MTGFQTLLIYVHIYVCTYVVLVYIYAYSFALSIEAKIRSSEGNFPHTFQEMPIGM